MGRLLEALKRLEPEISAAQPADPIVPVEISTDAAIVASQTAVLEPPFSPNETAGGLIEEEQQTENQSCHNIEAESRVADSDNDVVAEGNFAEVSVDFDRLDKFFNEELPLLEESTPEITLDGIEDETVNANESTLLVNESANDQLQEIPYEVPRAKENAKPIAANPETKKNHGEYGAMARNILAQLPGQGSVALFFTSPIDGEGKTEMILPLAEALIEESGRRTILVDANLHRPDLTQEWQFTSRKGIFDVLTGEADWWDAVQETGLPKLSILLNNGLPQQNAIVSQPLAFSELLANLKREYRLVMIDAASLTHDESIPMMRHCQGVYLVVRLGHSSRRTVWEASQVVIQAGGKLLGCIAVGDVLSPA